jgi:glycerophosphoryl diester phosphodiesterase
MSNQPTPTLFAHRGVSSEFPENTIPAFRAARFRGADGVELDVRRTSDGFLVVHHDVRLEDGRTIVESLVSELPAAVPRIDEALEACEGIKVNIEIKNMPGEPDFDPASAMAEGVIEAVRGLGRTADVIVSSFNLATLDEVRRLDPSIATGWLVFDIDDINAVVARAEQAGHTALHPFVGRTTAQLIEASHIAGLVVNTWTVDDPARIKQLVDDGVDGIITNVPEIAREAVQRALE